MLRISEFSSNAHIAAFGNSQVQLFHFKTILRGGLSKTMDIKITSPLKAIRAKCFDCCGGKYNEIRKCSAKNCPLYTYRFGKNPNRKKRELTPEQKEKMLKWLQKGKEKKNS